MCVDMPAMWEFSKEMNVPICGKDFKTGQTMLKTVLAPMLKTRMLGLDGWFSTNILGNRDGEVLDDPALVGIAKARGIAPATVALAWVLRHSGVIAIPKSSNVAHVEATAAAQDLKLEPAELAALDKAFPPPRKKVPLGML